MSADQQHRPRLPPTIRPHETDHGKLLRYPDKTHTPYRFGIIVDTLGPLRWEFRCVRRLMEDQSAVPRLVGIIAAPRHEKEGTGARDGAGLHVGRLYERLFSRLPSLQRVSTDELVQELARENCRVEVARDPSPDEPTAVEKIRKLDLDFILGFVEPDMLKRYRTMARMGTWHFSELNEKSFSGRIPFLDAIIRCDRTVHVSFPADGGEVDLPRPLWKGCYGVDPNTPGDSLERVLEDLSKWPLWVCGRIRNGATGMQADSSPVDVSAFRPGVGLGRALKWPLKLLWGKVTHKASEVFLRPQWNIAVLNRPIQTLLSDPGAGDARFLDIGTGVDTFRADPFGVPGDEFLTILFEKFDFETVKGIIAFLRVTDSGAQENAETVFEGSHHLSYPFIFENEGEIYCVPESGRAGKIEIHRAVQFPEKWESVALVGDSVSGIDSTVFRHNGLWWLACTMIGHELNTNLFLYYAERLTGPWTTHRGNPVKTDVRSSRPAGTPFVHRGELYRPSQDCSRSYGGRVCINRVLRLDPSEFVEEEVCTVEPAPGSGYPDGLHTISAVGDRTLIDGLRHRFTWKGVARSLRKRSRNLEKLVESLRRPQTR